jgi:hypothetical protein
LGVEKLMYLKVIPVLRDLDLEFKSVKIVQVLKRSGSGVAK